MSTFSTISYVHATVGFYHIFLVSLCYENDYLVYIYVFSHYCAMPGYVTFLEVTFMLGCPHSCIIGYHIILPLVQPIGVSYPFVYTILIETGHISNTKDGVIMCNNRNISLN